jgi:hypothetical protein
MGENGEEQGAAMAGRAPGPAGAREKSSFAVTCSLLSQYLKEKTGGLHGLGGMAPAEEGKRRHRSRGLLSYKPLSSTWCSAHAVHLGWCFI